MMMMMMMMIIIIIIIIIIKLLIRCIHLPAIKRVLTPKKAYNHIQGGSNMTGTDLYVNKPHCAAAVRDRKSVV